MYPAIAAELGLAMAVSGDIEGGTALLVDALRRKTYRFGGRYTEYYLLHNLGRVHLLADRLVDAQEQAVLAEALTRETGEHAHHAYTLKLLGDVRARRGDDDAKAEADYRSALAIAEPREMRLLLASCHHALSELYAADDRARAADERRLADELYKAMGLAPAPRRSGRG
jgi:hypothetical protein